MAIVEDSKEFFSCFNKYVREHRKEIRNKKMRIGYFNITLSKYLNINKKEKEKEYCL